MVYSNSYLYQSRHQIYYFRVTVPCQSKEGSRHYEYRRSLRTRNIATARSRGRFLRVYVELYQEGVRYGHMEWSEFKKLLDQSLADMLKAEKDYISSNGPYSVTAESLWRDNIIKNYKEAVEIVSLQRMGVSAEEPIPNYAYRVTDDFFNDHSMQSQHVDRQSPEYLKYCEAILLMQIEFRQQQLQLNEEARSFKGHSLSVPTSQHAQGGKDSPLLSEVVKKFITEREKGGSWNDKSKAENEASLRLLIRVVNDRSILSVDKDVARFYKEVLMELPSRMNRKPLYRDKTIDQIRSMTIPKEHKLSVSSINAYLDQASALFNWALDNISGVTQNPFKGLKLKDKVAGKDKRLPFTDNDLAAIFNTKEFQTNKRKHPYYYWLPLLGLYTGARIEELCQLFIGKQI